MSYAPKRACPVCRSLHCTDPAHVRKPWQGVPRTRQLIRPEYSSPAQVKRRAAVVAAFMGQHGIRLQNGDTIARCPDCGKMRARFVADHAVPIAYGGPEDGPLRVHCASCSGKQGARIANAARRG